MGTSVRAHGRVLLVDDEEILLHAFRRILTDAGYDVVTASDGGEAAACVAASSFDAIVSDIAMPALTGLEFLRVVRERDLDVPVILMTANPSVATAAQAIQLGVLAYLSKPIDAAEMTATIARAVHMHQLARIKREALDYLKSAGPWMGDRAGLEVHFSSALDTFWMAYQPIVSWSARKVFAFEALLRPTVAALPHPGAVIAAAERLGRLHDLGRRLRDHAADTVVDAAEVPSVFVNLHTQDLLDERLFALDVPLSRMAERVVLEITERESVDHVPDLRERVQRLRSMGFRIAVDDLGADYAGLTSFAQLEPDIVKIDMSLVRDVDKEPTKQRLIGSILTLCREMDIQVVCEGVETEPERDALLRLGCDLFQGYFFARPGRPFPTATFG
jgi:EAL domain-containing protein (putative c-di-GMP-specific phosphodiesterase class I)